MNRRGLFKNLFGAAAAVAVAPAVKAEEFAVVGSPVPPPAAKAPEQLAACAQTTHFDGHWQYEHGRYRPSISCG